MQLQLAEQEILVDVARRSNVDAQALIAAVEDESVLDLATALGIGEVEAARRLDPVRRAVAVGDDWGAGCKLLTDDIRAELQAALRGLGEHDPHSASPGVSQG